MIFNIRSEDELYHAINGYKKILIYGAGVVGRLTLKRIKQFDLITKKIYFVVKNKTGNPTEIDGVLVKELKGEESDAVLLVATLENLHLEIGNYLKKCGFKNIFFIQEPLLQEMKRKVVSQNLRVASYTMRISEMLKQIGNNGKKRLIITDYEENSLRVYWLKKEWETVSTEKFLDTDRKKTYDVIMCPLLSWDMDIQKVLESMFVSASEVIFSYRRNYLKGKFSLFEFAEQRGYILTKYQSFYRGKSEYNTDDIILKFEKAISANLQRYELCSGCGACALSCPQNALKMRPNQYGHLKPFLIDLRACNSCNSCISICREKGRDTGVQYFRRCYVKENTGKIADTTYMFQSLSKAIIERGGNVCGMTRNQKGIAAHCVISQKAGVHDIIAAGFIKGDSTESYLQVQELLKRNEQVLYIGYPCQVAGLYAFLGDTWDDLSTIDFFCNQSLPYTMSEKYFDIKTEKRRFFRSAFEKNLMTPVYCEHCSYCGASHPADLTFGTMGREKDGEETCVLVNTQKGTELLSLVDSKCCCFEELERLALRKVSCFVSCTARKGRDRFYELLRKKGFERAVDLAFYNKYEIGLTGSWSYPNYGAHLTYFSLYKVLEMLNYSVLLIEWPQDSRWKPYGYAQLFAYEPYENTHIAYPAPTVADMCQYNDVCDIFVQGSDQLLNPILYEMFQKNVLLKWASANKNKVAYGLSFGTDEISFDETGNFENRFLEADRFEISFYLNRFNKLSSRESSGVDILKEKFNVCAQQVLEPVFLCDKEEYFKLVSTVPYNGTLEKKFVFAYLLDCDEQKRNIISYVSKQKKCEIKLTLDAAKGNKDGWKGCKKEEMEEPQDTIEMWLSNIYYSDFCITDSFHGVCFCVIFEKEFIAIANPKRGNARFESLLSLLGLKERLIYSTEEIYSREDLFSNIDYKAVHKILREQRKKSLEWLKNSLENQDVNYSEEYRALSDRCQALESKLHMLEKKIADIN